MRTAAREKVILVAALARGSAVLKAALNGDQRARLRMLLDQFALGGEWQSGIYAVASRAGWYREARLLFTKFVPSGRLEVGLLTNCPTRENAR